jgi:dTDP-4-dehydrorhamnose reductase
LKILVLGNRGQVGLEVMRAAWPRGTRLVGAARPQFDITDPASIEAALTRHAPDVVVNGAAYTAVDKAESDRENAFAVNAAGPGRLAAACARHGSTLVHLSTDYVFDGSASRAYREDDPIAPINAYGQSKAAGEAAVRLQQPRHIILRTSWVYAAHGENFVRTMLRLACERETINVVSDQHGAPTSAGDIAAAIVAVTKKLIDGSPRASSFGTFHFTAKGQTTWHGFAEQIVRLYGHALARAPTIEPIPTSAFTTAAQRPTNSLLDCSRIESVFQIRCPPWRESLAGVVNDILATSGITTLQQSPAAS